VDDQVLPFYLVYDQTMPVQPQAADKLDQALSVLFYKVNVNAPGLGGVRLGLIGFGGDTRVLAPLGGIPVSGPFSSIKRTSRAGPPFGAAFRLLRSTILEDAAGASAASMKYLQPAVFFIAARNPTDDWGYDYQQLQAAWSPHPEIVAFGLTALDPELLRKITTTRTFLADEQTGLSGAMANLLACVDNCATDTGSALEKGSRRAFSPPRSVPGFAAIIPSQGDAVKDPSPAAELPPVPVYPEPAVIGGATESAVTPAGLPEGWHRVPDTVIDGADLDGLVIRGASVRGDKHRAAGTTRKDAMGIYRVRDGDFDAIVACVAGGADEASLSHLGAEQACLLARDEVAKRLPTLFGDPADAPAVCLDLIESVSSRLTRRAGFLNVDPAALATSLAFVVAEAGGDPTRRRSISAEVGPCRWFSFSADPSRLVVQSVDRWQVSDSSTSPVLGTEVTVGVAPLLPGEMLTIFTGGLVKQMGQDDLESHLLSSWEDATVPSLDEFGGGFSFDDEDAADDRTAIFLWIR
jgi:uncharacterized protein YegL